MVATKDSYGAVLPHKNRLNAFNRAFIFLENFFTYCGSVGPSRRGSRTFNEKLFGLLAQQFGTPSTTSSSSKKNSSSSSKTRSGKFQDAVKELDFDDEKTTKEVDSSSSQENGNEPYISSPLDPLDHARISQLLNVKSNMKLIRELMVEYVKANPHVPIPMETILKNGTIWELNRISKIRPHISLLKKMITNFSHSNLPNEEIGRFLEGSIKKSELSKDQLPVFNNFCVEIFEHYKNALSKDSKFTHDPDLHLSRDDFLKEMVQSFSLRNRQPQTLKIYLKKTYLIIFQKNM